MDRVRAGSAPGPARVRLGSSPGPPRVRPGSSPNPAQFSPRSALAPAQMPTARVFAHVLRLLHMLAHPCGPVNTSLRCARVPEKSTISQRAWRKVAEGALLPLTLLFAHRPGLTRPDLCWIRAGPGPDPGRTRGGPGADPGRTRGGPGPDPVQPACPRLCPGPLGACQIALPRVWAPSAAQCYTARCIMRALSWRRVHISGGALALLSAQTNSSRIRVHSL